LTRASLAQRELAQRILHPLTVRPDRSEWIQLVLLGFEDGTRTACPARDAEGHCRLHASGKPGACRAVPLVPWRADEEQPTVLEIRAKEARSWGVVCIGSEPAPLFRPLTRGLRVVDSEALAELAKRRRELEHDKQVWGNEVFRTLGRDLFARPERVAALPQSGFFVLSLVPVLLTLVPRSRERVFAYLEAQSRLAQRLLEHADALTPKLNQLRTLAATNDRLLRALNSGT